MAYTTADKVYSRQKSRIAHREPFAIRVGNWIAGTPPICAIHHETAVWHKNKARESGGQWACKTCSRLKSKGMRRLWKTDHTDPFTYNLKRMFTAAKHHSNKIGRSFNIEFNDLLEIWNKQSGRCAISNLEMTYLPGDNFRRRNKVTMDRINSSIGYEKGNVWLVCDWVNRAKSDLTYEELMTLARGIMDRLPKF